MNCAFGMSVQRRLSRMDSKARLVEGNQEVVSEDESSGQMQSQQAQIKQGWSLLAALHCILLPEKVGTFLPMSQRVLNKFLHPLGT